MEHRETEQLIDTLKQIREKPNIFFGDGMSSIDNFMSGFSIATNIFINRSQMISKYRELCEEQGLTGNLSVFQQLKQQGYNDEDAVTKYLSLVIDAYEAL